MYRSILLALPMLVSAAADAIESMDLMLDSVTVLSYNHSIRAPGTLDLSSLVLYAKNVTDVGDKHHERDKELEDDTIDYDVDIVATIFPQECATTPTGCDWTELGIGVKMNGVTHYCCVQDLIDAGLCPSLQYGRLIIMDDFKGSSMFVPIPKEGEAPVHLRSSMIRVRNSGIYAVAFANCYPGGRQVQIKGDVVWQSSDRESQAPSLSPFSVAPEPTAAGFLFLYMFMTAMYFGALCWYGVGMHQNAEYRIPIERWILLTMALGLLEMLFRSCDLFLWNEDRDGVWFIATAAAAIKQGIACCIMLMLSLGWGAIEDSSRMPVKAIIVLGIVYGCLLFAHDLVSFFAWDDASIFVALLARTIGTVTVVFIVWILVALSSTMNYLQGNQSRKRWRYVRLGIVFLLYLLFATICAIFVPKQSFGREGRSWRDAATDVNDLFLLLCVAYMWRPNNNHARVMELSGIGEEVDGHELELADNKVPSAVDQEVEDENGTSGLYGKAYRDVRFQIDDAEAA